MKGEMLALKIPNFEAEIASYLNGEVIIENSYNS